MQAPQFSGYGTVISYPVELKGDLKSQRRLDKVYDGLSRLELTYSEPSAFTSSLQVKQSPVTGDVLVFTQDQSTQDAVDKFLGESLKKAKKHPQPDIWTLSATEDLGALERENWYSFIEELVGHVRGSSSHMQQAITKWGVTDLEGDNE